MSDSQPSSRDEKGLTLSGRTILRLLLQFSKLLAASNKLGGKAGYELLQSPLVLVELRSLLWIATEMGKRIGSIAEVEAYLNGHNETDETTLIEGMKQSGRELLEEVLEHSGLPKCTSCGKLMCPICRECHECSTDKNHKLTHTPFGTSGGTLN